MTGFQVRDWKDYTQTMAAWIAANTGLVPGYTLPNDLVEGSLERAHLEALAVIMEDFDVRAQNAIDYAVNNSVYNAFGFPALSAQAAIGAVTFTCLVAPAADIDIPVGTKVGTASGIQYVTTMDATMKAGTFTAIANDGSGTNTLVPVQAVNPGVAGNVGASQVSRILYPIAGVDGVTNPAPISGGADAETDASRATRFRAWVNTLVRGTKEALEFCAIYVANCGVIDALAVEPWLLTGSPAGQGNVYLFLDNGFSSASFTLGGTLVGSGGQGYLVTAVTSPSAVPGSIASALNGSPGVGGYLNGQYGPNNTYQPGWKAAGIKVSLFMVPRCPVFLTASVVTASTGKGRFADIQTALTNAANAYFNSVTTGQTLTYHGLLVALSMADPDIVSVQLSLGLDNNVAHNVLPGVDLAWNQLDPIQVGCRWSLQQDGTYPIWNLS